MAEESKRGWPGAKAAAFRHLVNLMPPHDVYLELFLGDGAVMRVKRPARLNIGLDLDPDAPGLAWLEEKGRARSRILDPRVRFGESAGGIGNGGEARRHSASGAAASPSRGGSGNGRNGAGVLPGTASPALARSPGASSGLASVDRLSPDGDLASPESARSAEARGAPHAKAGDPGSYGGNGAAADYRFGCLDGIEFLRVYPFTGVELVYCDPPYLMSTRSGKRLYKHEMSDVDHRRFLRVAIDLPCMVMVSGYWSQLYADAFTNWNSIHFQAMTRGGRPATEWLWFNFPVPTVLHDDRFLGEGFRARANLTKMKKRWVAKLKAMGQQQRQALLSAIASIDNSGEVNQVANSPTAYAYNSSAPGSSFTGF